MEKKKAEPIGKLVVCSINTEYNGILSKERYDRYKEIFARIDEKWRRRYD